VCPCAAQARLKGEAARFQDKVEMYRYYVQVFGTRDHEGLLMGLGDIRCTRSQSVRGMLIRSHVYDLIFVLRARNRAKVFTH